MSIFMNRSVTVLIQKEWLWAGLGAVHAGSGFGRFSFGLASKSESCRLRGREVYLISMTTSEGEVEAASQVTSGQRPTCSEPGQTLVVTCGIWSKPSQIRDSDILVCMGGVVVWFSRRSWRYYKICSRNSFIWPLLGDLIRILRMGWLEIRIHSFGSRWVLVRRNAVSIRNSVINGSQQAISGYLVYFYIFIFFIN